MSSFNAPPGSFLPTKGSGKSRSGDIRAHFLSQRAGTLRANRLRNENVTGGKVERANKREAKSHQQGERLNIEILDPKKRTKKGS